MLSDRSVRKSVAIAFAISIAASSTALCPTAFRARGETATLRADRRWRNPLISRLRIMRSVRQVQQALLRGLNTGPTRGKMPERSEERRVGKEPAAGDGGGRRREDG